MNCLPPIALPANWGLPRRLNGEQHPLAGKENPAVPPGGFGNTQRLDGENEYPPAGKHSQNTCKKNPVAL